MPLDPQLQDPYANVETPEDITNQQQAQYFRQLALAQPQNTGAMFGAQANGMMAGNAIGSALQQIAPSDRMLKAQQDEQARQSAPTDPDQLEAYADMAQRTSPELADAMRNKANQIRSDKAKLVESASKAANDAAQAKLYGSQADYYSAKALAPNGPTKMQKTPWGGNYDPATGQYYDAAMNPLTPDAVALQQTAYASRVTDAQTKARSQALLSDFTKNGSMDSAIQYFKVTGKIPPGITNRSSPAIAAQFYAGIAADAAASGNTVQANYAAAQLHGLAHTGISQITTQLANNTAFTEQMHKNIESVDDTMKQLTGNNPKLANIIWQGVAQNVTSGPYAKMIAAAKPYINAINSEAAKIAAGRVGSVGSLSDKQMAKQAELLNTAQSYDVWRSAADALQTEGANRVSTLNDTLNGMSQYIQGGNAPTVKPPTPAAGATKPEAKTVTHAVMLDYAKTHNLTPGKAAAWLASQGYTIE